MITRQSAAAGAEEAPEAATAADRISGSPQHRTLNFRPLLLPESSASSSHQGSNKFSRAHQDHGCSGLTADAQSRESSPTCVIGNALTLVASSSSCTSPTEEASLSKASIDIMDRASDIHSDVKELVSKNHHGAPNSSSHLEAPDDEVFYSPSRNEQLLLKGGRGNKKVGLLDTPGRQGIKGGFGKRSSDKETNSWASVHDALHLVDAANEVAFVTKNSLALRDAHSKEAQTMPFKSVQSPSMDQQKLGCGGSEETKKSKAGLTTGIVSATARPIAQQQERPGSVMNGGGSIFSFNSTHSVRGADSSTAESYDYDSNFDKDSSASFDFNRAGVYRAAVGSLLKPTPSKWDDAEKWLSASDQAPGSAKAGTTKSKSGPLQKHVVANQAGGVAVSSTKKVTFSNLATAWSRQADTPNGSTTHLPKATNADADADHYGRAAAASSSSSSSSSSSCKNSGCEEEVQSSEEQSLDNCAAGGGPGGRRTKKVDSSAAKYMVTNEEGSEETAIAEPTVAPDLARFAFMPMIAPPMMATSGGAVDRYPLNDTLYGRDHHGDDAQEGLSLSPDATTDDMFLKPALLRTAKPTSESATDYPDSPNKLEESGGIMVNHPVRPADLSLAVGSPGTNTRGAVSTRDMGTEMTPLASVDPSRTATPVRATTPNLGSPINSRPSTPDRGIVLSSTPGRSNANNKNNNSYSCSSRSSGAAGPGKTSSSSSSSSKQECSTSDMQSTSSATNSKVLTGKELQAKTRQEILALGTQLGKPNIAAWATKEEEEADAAKSLKASVELEEVRKNLLASRAAAWEEAEQAKYSARYKREEAKIQAWENHEKAKAEAEMRRIEVKVERMWSHANEKLMNKLAAAHRRAEDLRAAAEARRGEQIAKAAAHAEHIRATGQMPAGNFFFFLARLCQ